jgi:hypothetical protein
MLIAPINIKVGIKQENHEGRSYPEPFMECVVDADYVIVKSCFAIHSSYYYRKDTTIFLHQIFAKGRKPK